MEGAFQTTGCSFTGAPKSTGGTIGGGVGCTNNGRAFMFNPTLVIPADISDITTFTSGWAVSPKTGSVAEPFLLMPPQPTMPPTHQRCLRLASSSSHRYLCLCIHIHSFMLKQRLLFPSLYSIFSSDNNVPFPLI